jgi:hypothetical protein
MPSEIVRLGQTWLTQHPKRGIWDLCFETVPYCLHLPSTKAPAVRKMLDQIADLLSQGACQAGLYLITLYLRGGYKAL